MSRSHPVCRILLILFTTTMTVQAAEPTTHRMPRVIVMNDEGTMYRYYMPERPEVTDVQRMLDIYPRSGVDTLAQCFHVRFQAFYDSQVAEIAGDLTPEAVRPFELTHYWQMITAMRHLVAEGNDPPRVMASALHERGMLFLAGLRLNDKHGLQPWEGHYGSLRRDHPQWKLADAGNAGMDYAVPQVREAVLDVVRELAERYDIDGIDLDFMRWPHYFQDEAVRENTPVMTGFVREIRAILDEAGEKKGRHLLLMARVPLKIGTGDVINAYELHVDLECLGVGLDVPTWIREELIDVVSPMGFFHNEWDRMITALPQWRRLTEASRCRLYPTIHGSVAHGYDEPYITAASYRGAAYSYLKHGADGIAIYNFWPQYEELGPLRWHDPLGAIPGLGDVSFLASKARRYHCLVGGKVIVGPHDAQLTRKDERKAIDFFLPEDPNSVGVVSRLRFVGRNLTGGHIFAVDINGTPVDPDTVQMSRLLSHGGTPDGQYANVVEISLADSGAVLGANVLGVKWIQGNPEIPFKRATNNGALWGGFIVSEVEAIFEPSQDHSRQPNVR